MKTYETPVIGVTKLATVDVITASGDGTNNTLDNIGNDKAWDV